MERIEIIIKPKGSLVSDSQVRAKSEKWKFQDTMMGEQYITLTIKSETPINFSVGDYCVFRGEVFTLNYKPSVKQRAATGSIQDAYTYENIRFDSYQDETTRCTMLDITPAGDYDPHFGTDYTGSSKFDLYCGETTIEVEGETVTLTPVCTLAAKIQANLDRAYGQGVWEILVDTTTEYISSTGETRLVTHTDDKMLSFNKETVAQAIARVKNDFNLNYCIKGRKVYIGYTLEDVTSDDEEEMFAFGYGSGYPSPENQGKGLFEITKVADSKQLIVTRLRVVGSTKNLPYRYYNKKYNLPSSFFPTTLQLPDTFASQADKNAANARRDAQYGYDEETGLPKVRHVLGTVNDAYIDKGDNAATCDEGVREDVGCWDGTDSDKPEIYPTIEDVKYEELRAAGVEDQDGYTEESQEHTDSHGKHSFLEYEDDERINEILAVGYLRNGVLVNDANEGDGIMPESGNFAMGSPYNISVGTVVSHLGDFTTEDDHLVGREIKLFTIEGVKSGSYAIAPTSAMSALYNFWLERTYASAKVGFRINIKIKKLSDNSVRTLTYFSDFIQTSTGEAAKSIELPELPDVKNLQNAQIPAINVDEDSDVTVTIAPTMQDNTGSTLSLLYNIWSSDVLIVPQYTWIDLSRSTATNGTFHIIIKDMGFDPSAVFGSETPVVSMKEGMCVGREFEIGSDIKKVTYNGRKGYQLTLKRATDSSLNTYYPSRPNFLSAGDKFVLLNIEMPDAYVSAAEVRLLLAASDYLALNCETRFTYQPKIDDIYLQRNIDRMAAASTPEKSIFWRLYAGMLLKFKDIPNSSVDQGGDMCVTIKQVTIDMGDNITPKVDITLSDDIQQTTLQKVTANVNKVTAKLSGMSRVGRKIWGQQFSGDKDITGDFILGDLKKRYDDYLHAWVLESLSDGLANLVVTGGITAYASNVQPDSWVDAIPIDNDTIVWDNGVLKATPSSGSDFDEDAMWEILSTYDGQHSIDIDYIDGIEDVYLQKAGGTMTGNILLGSGGKKIESDGDAVLKDVSVATLEIGGHDVGDLYHPKEGSYALPMKASRVTSAGGITAYSVTEDTSEEIIDAIPVDETLSKDGGVLHVVSSDTADEALEKAEKALDAAEGVGTWLSEKRTLAEAIDDVPTYMRMPAFMVNYRPTQTTAFVITVTSNDLTVEEGEIGVDVYAPDGFQDNFFVLASAGESLSSIATRLADAMNLQSIGEHSEWRMLCSYVSGASFTVTIENVDAPVSIVRTGPSSMTINNTQPYEAGQTLTYQYSMDEYTANTWSVATNWKRVNNSIKWNVIM